MIEYKDSYVCPKIYIYIKNVVKRFRTNKCFPSPIPIQKGDKCSLIQCPKNDLERKWIEDIPYACIVRSLMYAQTSTRLYIRSIIGMFDRDQSNLGQNHWKIVKKVLRSL